ncbi:hypothetical protein SVXHr_2719 [Halorhabdus sp. SVX81]|nr:hypothetical protein SVXHr_2719 [Halorhabdus sp. SVX81]
MQVTLADIPDFDWDQYNSDANKTRPGGQPSAHVIEKTDATKLHLDNVWITTDKTPDGKACHVKFRFITELESSFVESGEIADTDVDRNTVWSAERVSTEPVTT